MPQSTNPTRPAARHTSLRAKISNYFGHRYRVRIDITLRGQRQTARFQPWTPLEFVFPDHASYRAAKPELYRFLERDHACLDPCQFRKEPLGERYCCFVIPYIGTNHEREREWAEFLRRVFAFCQSQGWERVEPLAPGVVWTEGLVSWRDRTVMKLPCLSERLSLSLLSWVQAVVR